MRRERRGKSVSECEALGEKREEKTGREGFSDGGLPGGACDALSFKKCKG